MKIGVHAEDIDGISCAALLLKVFPDAEIKFLTPRQAETTDEEFDIVADIYKPKRAKVVIDHHKTNLERLKAEGRLTPEDLIDPTSPSAAALVAKKFGLDDEISKEIINIANHADQGIFLSKEAELLDLLVKAHVTDQGYLLKIARTLAMYGASFAEDAWLKKELKRIEKEFEELKHLVRDAVEDALARGIKFAIFDARGLPYSVVKKLASIFSKIGGLVGISIYEDGEDLLRASIRISKSFDGIKANELAQKFGGGGHEKAAGFYIKNLPEAVYTLLSELGKFGLVGYIRVRKCD